jgi:uncharacterized protein YndB with AHSA1/START domain
VRARTYEITVRKVLPASPAEVFAAWSDPETYNSVHGCVETRIDFRPGGRIETRFFPDRPGGETFVLLEIDAPRRMVFAWEDHEEYRVTLETEHRGEETEVSITQDCREDPAWIRNCLEGWAWILDSEREKISTAAPGTRIATPTRRRCRPRPGSDRWGQSISIRAQSVCQQAVPPQRANRRVSLLLRAGALHSSFERGA